MEGSQSLRPRGNSAVRLLHGASSQQRGHGQRQRVKVHKNVKNQNEVEKS